LLDIIQRTKQARAKSKLEGAQTMINIDMWHNDKIKAVEKINIFFNDLTGKYWGNCYINNKAIGDFTADSSTDIEKTFEHLAINWN
jgi:hypothetical protein